jgi:3-hydroxyisobutyrate dehydrogenase-like beta-hydroxyacid dehydrogenase
MSEIALRKVAIIGFGEAGSLLGAGLVAAGLEVVMYDILLDAPAAAQAMSEKARASWVRSAPDTAAAIEGADLVMSAVTAGSSATVAAEAARSLRAGQIFLDINSVSPATKQGNARTVERSGADYVEAAVMAPVPAQRMKVPMLLGGRRAEDLANALRKLGMNTTPIADRIGVASAVKMCRSVMIKGIEALAVESLMAARRFGAEEQVLASLNGTFPGMGWLESLPDYLVSRVAEHGRRRAAEMREVALTLQDVGVDPTMARATATRQEWLIDEMAARGVAYPRDKPFSWRALADALKE